MRLLSSVLAAATLTFAPLALAEGDHHITPVSGSHQIDMKYYDHALAGQVKDFVIFGNKAGASSEFYMKKGGELVKATFGRQTDGTTGGTISQDVDGRQVVTTLKLVNADAAANRFSIQVNDETVTFQITNDGMDGNHHINPKFTGTYKGETVEWKIEDGSACMGCAVHLAFWILGAIAAN